MTKFESLGLRSENPTNAIETRECVVDMSNKIQNCHPARRASKCVVTFGRPSIGILLSHALETLNVPHSTTVSFSWYVLLITIHYAELAIYTKIS